MQKLHLRRLRVQVLLWTILPLIIFLIAFSFTGIGSHHQSMLWTRSNGGAPGWLAG